MKSHKFRDIAFRLHRYIGLVVGVFIAFIGLTGSFLVFKPEIEQLLISQQIGRIVPQEQIISLDSVLETAKSAISQNNQANINSANPTSYYIRLPATASSPYEVEFFDNNKAIRLFVHPYTGEIITWNDADSSFERVILYLHYSLMLGINGQIAVGIVALLLLILSITGLILWPGWRKLITGFKIKWDGHPKRVNFDIHKVVGIVATIFLCFSAFTGFCWNLSHWTYPLIYAVTFTSQPPEVAAKPISDSTPLQLSQLLENSNQVFPNATTLSVTIPSKPEDAVYISKRQNHETVIYGQSGVYLDGYSGEILRVVDSTKLPLGDKAIAILRPLHYGTFWGLTSRIIYFLVGLTPTILLITGFIMWRYRPKPKSTK